MGLSFSLMIDLASISMETVHFQTHGSSRSLSDLASNSQWKRASSDRISNATDTLTDPSAETNRAKLRCVAANRPNDTCKGSSAIRKPTEIGFPHHILDLTPRRAGQFI
jgi:hypothetical protein